MTRYLPLGGAQGFLSIQAHLFPTFFRVFTDTVFGPLHLGKDAPPCPSPTPQKRTARTWVNLRRKRDSGQSTGPISGLATLQPYPGHQVAVLFGDKANLLMNPAFAWKVPLANSSDQQLQQYATMDFSCPSHPQLLLGYVTIDEDFQLQWWWL